jgi:hypothetical protein
MKKIAALIGLALSVLALGCGAAPSSRLAALGISSIQSVEGRRQGVAGPIAWWAGDMQVISRVNPDGAYDVYVFTLVLTNTGEVPVSIVRMDWNTMDQGIILGSPASQAVSWSIAPRGERRTTWPYSLVCPRLYNCAPTQDSEPTWTFHFTGATAQGQPIDVPISVTLPAQTLRTRFQW